MRRWRSHRSSSSAARAAPSPTARARRRSSSWVCNANEPSDSARSRRIASIFARMPSFSAASDAL